MDRKFKELDHLEESAINFPDAPLLDEDEFINLNRGNHGHVLVLNAHLNLTKHF